MFGDVGHGLLLLALGIYLVFFLNKPLSNLNKIKYMIFMMGIFSVSCGFIYNEFFSFPLVFLESCYKIENLKP